MGTLRDDLERTGLARFTLDWLLFGVVPLLVAGTIVAAWLVQGGGTLGIDVEEVFLPAARDVLDGASPYPLPGDPRIEEQTAYVYSPLVAYLAVPLTWLPVGVAIDLWIVASMLGALAVLAVVGVRDWRCYGVALVWPPVLNSAASGAVSVGLALLLAAAWRFRQRELASGALIGSAVAVKMVVWPLLAWPAVLGRGRSALAGVATAAGLSLGTWALIGFAGLADYPDLLRAVSDAGERNSYSLSAALMALGAPEPVAHAALLLAAIGLIGIAVRFGRSGDEARAFVALVLASLAATPVLWQHYLTLLLVALAVARPRLSAAWLLPVLLFAAPWVWNGAAWQTVLVPAVTATVGLLCLRPGEPDRVAQAAPGSARTTMSLSS